MADPKEPLQATPPTQPSADATTQQTAAGEGAPPPPASEIDQLRDALARAQAEIADLRDQFLRAKAEAENARRRALEDIAKAHKYGVERFAEALVPVRDSIEAALATQNATIERYREGIEITLRQLTGAFEKSGLVEIDPAGEKFDPHRHQAIASVPAEGEANRVVAVMQKGYLIADRVLRPALVSVSAPKPMADTASSAAPSP